MLIKALVSVLILSVSATCFAGDFGPGNGGDLAHCKASNDNSFNGLYSLDYLLTFNRRNNNDDIVKIENWEQSSQRLLKIFKEYLPYYYKSFKNYIKHVGNFNDYSASHIWLDYPGKLIDIEDESLIRKIPENCQEKNNQVFQAVIRKYESNQIQYEIDGELYDRLERSPLQYSFLMIHEYLWQLFENSRQIRSFNRVLHSNIFEIESKYEILETIGRFSFKNNESAKLETKMFDDTLRSFFNDSADQFYNKLMYHFNSDIQFTYDLIDTGYFDRNFDKKYKEMHHYYLFRELRSIDGLNFLTYSLIYSKNELLNLLINNSTLVMDKEILHARLVSDNNVYIKELNKEADNRILQAFALGYERTDVLNKLKELGQPDPSYYLNNIKDYSYRKALLLAILEKDNLENYIKLNSEYGLQLHTLVDLELIIFLKSKRIMEYLINQGLNIWTQLEPFRHYKFPSFSRFSTEEKFLSTCKLKYYIVINNKNNALFYWLLEEQYTRALSFFDSLSNKSILINQLRDIKWDVEIKETKSYCDNYNNIKKEKRNADDIIIYLHDSTFKSKFMNLFYE